MGAILSYSILSSVFLTFFYLAYKLLLAKEKQAVFNRIILLSIFGASLLLPLLDTSFKEPAPTQTEISTGTLIESGPVSISFIPQQSASNPIANLLLIIYLSGICVAVIITLISIIQVMHIIRTAKKERKGLFTIVISEDHTIAPFSWLNYIVINAVDNQTDNALIISHESRHIRSLHWIDMCFARIISIIQWYNPVAWLIVNELRTIHEFEADESVIDQGADTHTYQMLLIKKAAGARFPSLASNLNHSNLKKRITMMYKSNSSGISRWKALGLIPAGLAALLLANVPAVASVLNSADEAQLSAISGKDSKIPEPLQVSDAEDTSTNTLENSAMYDEMPEFPGGYQALFEFIQTNMRYPESAIKANKEGRVVVRFTIEADGSVKKSRNRKRLLPGTR